MTDIGQSSITVNHPLLALLGDLEPGSPGDCWARIKLHLPASTDLRARSGSFTTPWNAVSPYRQPLPDLATPENRSFKELMDSRAQEIYQSSRSLGKKLMLMWSGGIDSTGMLTALLKHIPTNEQADLITICLTPDSIMENFEFYRRYISGRLPIIHKINVDISDDFFRNTIITSGDTADHLFFFGGLAFRERFGTDIWTKPWRDNLDRLLNPQFENHSYSWKFLYSKVVENMRQSDLPDLNSVGDVFYWLQLNFMWEGTNLRPLHTPSMRKDFRTTIQPKHVHEFLDHIFYSTKDFQRWSFTNRHRQQSIPYANHTFKQELRDYIVEFDGNRSYHQFKQKIVSMSFDQINDVHWNTHLQPVYFDQNWRGYTLEDQGVKDLILQKLKEYQG